MWHALLKWPQQTTSHCCDVIMSAMASEITGVSIIYQTACSDAYQRKHQSSASLAFVRGIHRWPVNSPHKRPVTRKKFPFDDVIMWRNHTSVQTTHDKMILLNFCRTIISDERFWFLAFQNKHWILQLGNISGMSKEKCYAPWVIN